MTDLWAKISVWLFMTVMLIALVGAIPMAIWTDNNSWLVGLLAFVFFAS
jgi:hypothetical protein